MFYSGIRTELLEVETFNYWHLVHEINPLRKITLCLLSKNLIYLH
jgi:hypothetical protein